MASNLIPPVVAKLTANISEFKKGMGDAKKEMSSAADTGSSKFGALAVGIGAGMAVAGAAVIGFASKSVGTFEKVAGEVAKLSRLTGGTAEDMSRLRFEAQQTGVPFETLTKSMLKMSKGVMSGSDVFAKYGIATKGANREQLSMNEILMNAADVFNKMPNGIEKNALAMSLFGKAGTDMIPMLSKGRSGLAELAGEADKFGQVIGKDDVDAMKENKKAHREMSAAMEGLQIQLGKNLMPIVAKVATFFAENMPLAVAAMKSAMHALGPVIQFVQDLFARIVDWVKAHWDQISATVQAGVAYMRDVIRTAVEVVQQIWQRFGSNILDVIRHAWDAVQKIVEAALQVVRGIINVVTGLIHGDWSKVWDGLKSIVTGIWDAISAYVVYAINLVKNYLEVGWAIITSLFSKVWDGLKAIVAAGLDAVIDFLVKLPGRALSALASLGSLLLGAGKAALGFLWNGIKAGWEAEWNFFTGLPGKVVDALGTWGSKLYDLGGNVIHSLWDGIKKAWNWLADKTTFTLPKFHIPGTSVDIGGGTVNLLPHLASGGLMAEAGLALVGERGPEVVALPAGAAVYPNGTGPAGGGVQVVQNFYGITDHRALARSSSREIAWAIKTRAA